MAYKYIQTKYKHIRVTYEWHARNIQIHTIDIQIAYEWHANNTRNIKP